MRIFLVIIALVLCLPVCGQDGSGDIAEKNSVQSEEVLRPVNLDKGLLKKHESEKPFIYARHKAPDNWWDRFTTWVAQTWKDFWRNLFGTPEAKDLGSVFEVVKYVIIALVIGLIIYLFIKMNPGNTVLKEPEQGKVFLTEDEEIIKEKDIPELIKGALSREDYRLALRYSYLLVLRDLDQKDVIEFEAQKTNADYLSELKTGTLADNFKTITRLYDFTWYGGFSLSAQGYKEAGEKVDHIKSELKSQGHE